MLQAEVAKARPAPGSAIVIKYRGMKSRKSGDGRYHDFDVVAADKLPGASGFEQWQAAFEARRAEIRYQADEAAL